MYLNFKFNRASCILSGRSTPELLRSHPGQVCFPDEEEEAGAVHVSCHWMEWEPGGVRVTGEELKNGTGKRAQGGGLLESVTQWGP